MEELASKLLGVWDSGFAPTHTRNLANQFKCYVNYHPKTLSSEADQSTIATVSHHPETLSSEADQSTIATVSHHPETLSSEADQFTITT